MSPRLSHLHARSHSILVRFCELTKIQIFNTCSAALKRSAILGLLNFLKMINLWVFGRGYVEKVRHKTLSCSKEIPNSSLLLKIVALWLGSHCGPLCSQPLPPIVGQGTVTSSVRPAWTAPFHLSEQHNCMFEIKKIEPYRILTEQS